MGYLFSALTGKIAHFNEVNRPIDNELGAKIRALEESPEKLLAIYTFGLTQEIVSAIFNPNDGVFRGSTSSLTPEVMKSIYNTLMDVSAHTILLPGIFKDEVKEKFIETLAKFTDSTKEAKEADIKRYSDTNSSVMKVYENIISLLKVREDGRDCVVFGTEFMRITEEIQSRLLATIFNKPNK